MDTQKNMLTRAEINEYIAKHYRPDDEENKGFLSVFKEPRTYIPGYRTAYTAPSGDMLKRLLDGIRSQLELTFSEKLLELISKSGQKPSAIYKKADITKDHFAKIKGNKNYRPSKDTAVAFAIALHLNLNETEDLIGRAGYTLSNSIKKDVIVRCYIDAKVFNIEAINITLDEYGYAPLTGKQYS
ncbi:XRE family transcriptional regulator [uncultured Anaerovibrio sp.]|uniref:XRE family transcriptional regulator n=1 Tax=uncultured Anaerovibrio sp. TaxID=361586 RepID=UPI0025DDC1EA|nr:XRE family transcriptional regulator [uncultured Anaerovibrio sp.]